ncbi:hypothetical protein [Actinomadura sp. NPDC048394]|uniref:hypothetical protein n=1 Tax=Actinomadura sp. NPDC048394 TaxID=3158223 RepID=UPI0034004CE3
MSSSIRSTSGLAGDLAGLLAEPVSDVIAKFVAFGTEQFDLLAGELQVGGQTARAGCQPGSPVAGRLGDLTLDRGVDVLTDTVGVGEPGRHLCSVWF